ncbi:MarR family winged helix-turn-helix transcriptional regulator [Saccharothrix sp. Mg75]|uniref:MarR family winged helix-turn-helix transcriptional regulator n=1 Tax=Saccharothrix sp. Mg75 TaxID=3445357 RepID=UPI003EF06BA3
MGFDRVDWGIGLVRLEIALWDRVDALLRAEHDLALSAFEALHVVARTPGGVRVGDLAVALRVTVGGTSKLVDRAERAGLLERLPDPDDRRAARVALTDAGATALAAATTTYDAAVADLLDGVLTDDEQRRFGEFVARLLDHLGGTR